MWTQAAKRTAFFSVLVKTKLYRKAWKFIHSPGKFTLSFSLTAYIYNFSLEVGYIQHAKEMRNSHCQSFEIFMVEGSKLQQNCFTSLFQNINMLQ